MNIEDKIALAIGRAILRQIALETENEQLRAKLEEKADDSSSEVLRPD